MKRRPSISDIAEETGVSIATVSLALRDKGRMSESTRDRVKETAAKLGYAPNANARSLVGGKTQLISLSLPGINMNPEVVSSVSYFFRLLGAAAAKALELDYSLVVTSPGDRPDRVAVDGAVVVDPSFDDSTIAAFDRLEQPVVTIGRRLDESGSYTGKGRVVDNDFPAATRAMLDHLKAQGSESILLLSAEPIDSFQKDSIDAYREWCAEQGIDPRVVTSKSPLVEDANIAVENVVTGPNRPDGVYSTIDILAAALLDRANEAGLKVPEDLRIATCSDSRLTRSTNPPLTTFDEKPVELGEAAVALLIESIEDPDNAPDYIQVETELIIRGSTA